MYNDRRGGSPVGAVEVETCDANRDLVTRMAEDGKVEDLIRRVTRRQVLTPALQDLAQEIYLTLLTYDTAKLRDLEEHGQMNFFLVGIIRNQLADGPHARTYRGYDLRSRELNETVEG